MKKLLGLLVLPALFLTGCSLGENNIENDVEILGVEAIASLNAAADFKQARTANDEVIAKLEQADILLAEEISFKEAESDREEYSIKYVITYQGLDYQFYVADLKYEVDDEESEMDFTGVLVNGDAEYRYEAEYETEEDDEESERELNLTLYYTETKIVKIEREFEVENGELEESFKYTLIDNGEVITSYEIERENDENEKTLEITINLDKYKYTFYTLENVEYVEVKVNDITYNYQITDNNGVKEYTVITE